MRKGVVVTKGLRLKKRTAKDNRHARTQRNTRFELLVEAVESIRDYGIFMLNTRGEILTWNVGAERITGYAKKEIIGKSFSAFYTDEDRARKHPEAELKEAKKTGRYEEEGWRVRKDGSRFWSSVVITKLTGPKGQLIGFSKVTRDLTVRRELEERLRISEERNRMLVQSVKDYAIFMLDPQGYVATWNEGAARIKGYTAAEIVGKHFSTFYPDEEIRAGKCEYELREAALTGRYEEEGWRVRKDGTQFWANVIISAVRDEKRNLLGFAKVTRDLTERKRAEDRIQRAYAELERRVLDRTEELRAANERLARNEDELRDAVRVRDEFLSIASHELKTPITSLKMQIQLLQQRSKGSTGQLPPADKLEKFLAGSLRQVNRLTQLVDDLLDVARAESRKLEFRFEPFDLRLLAADVLDRLRVQAEAAGCVIDTDGGGPVMGNFDRFRLDQVLVNLLTNAIKYAPGTHVRLSLEREGGRAVIRVSDQGPGVPAEAQRRLFERFERGENSKNIGGLGLGLFITKEIVTGHRGTIRVESEPGKGASFVVELPTDLPVDETA